MDYSNFLFVFDSVLAGCIFLGIFPFLLGCPICWHIDVQSNLYDPLYLCGISCNFASFISHFIFLCTLSFLLMSLVKGLSILFVFSKNKLLYLLILCIVLLISTSFNSALIMIVSFLVHAVGFVCSSSSCRCRVRLFI